ncbi:MAG: hypothetical protein R2724_19045 [Bryobacterales bacterium]
MSPTPRFALLALMLWTTALGAQSLVVSPLQLDFTAELGQPSPATQTLNIQSTPAGQSFSAFVNRNQLVNPAWLLDPFPTNGQTPATLTVTVDTSGFTAPTTGTADIIVSSGGEQKVVKVTITVTQPSQGPLIEAAPTALSFNVQAPGLAAAPQNLIVSNGGGGFLDYLVGPTYPAGEAQNWLQISPTSGQVSFGSRVHQIQVPDTSSLAEGTYTASILIQSAGTINSPLTIPVTLTVGAAPALTATPASLSFFASDGGASPDIQTVTIANSGGQDLQYAITGDQPWLAVNPESGNTAGGQTTHQVAVTTSGMTQGVYLGNLQVTGSSLAAPFLIPVRLTIGPPSTLFVLPQRLDFLGNSGIPIRERRSISVVNTPLGAGPWSARVTPSNATWLKVSPAQGRVPARLQVEVDTSGLGQSNLEAAIEITPASGSSGSGVQQSAQTITVPVRATILANPPNLAAAPQALLFRSTEGRDGVLQQALLVDNTGGPQLLWQSEITVESGDWLSLSRVSGEAPTRTIVSADTTGLTTGTYHGRIRLFAGNQSINVPVVLSVASTGASLDTDVSALYWEMVEGGTPPASREVQVLNRGAGTMNWTATIAEVSSSQQWFGLGPASGASRADGLAGPDTFTVSPIGTGLGAGVYGGLIEVRAQGQNPRLVSATLRVVAASEAVQRRVTPGGVVFSAGAGMGSKTATIDRSRSGAAPFVAGTSTTDGANWLSVTPTSGNAGEDGKTTLTLSADPTGLAAGVYTGQAGLTFGDGVVETVTATLIVAPGGSSACTPTAFTVVPISPGDGFRAFAGRAVKLEAEVWDDCGQAVDEASVLATFNTGDGAVPLRRVAPGRYAATWAPANGGSQASIAFVAMAGAQTAQRFVTGGVEGSAHPAISRLGVVNAGSFALGEAISPGAIISVFGRNFQTGALSADTVPLPTQLGGLSLRMSGETAPLYFKNNTQINAQAPVELIPNATAQAVAELDGAYSVPEEIAVAATRPGVFALASQPDRAIVQFPNGALSGPAVPVRAGDTVTVYLSGIGAVSPAVETNSPPPAVEPFARDGERQRDRRRRGRGGHVPGLDAGLHWAGAGQQSSRRQRRWGSDIPFVLSVGDQPSKTLFISVGAPLQ